MEEGLWRGVTVSNGSQETFGGFRGARRLAWTRWPRRRLTLARLYLACRHAARGGLDPNGGGAATSLGTVESLDSGTGLAHAVDHLSTALVHGRILAWREGTAVGFDTMTGTRRWHVTLCLGLNTLGKQKNYRQF